ncbi:DgyrCDS1489 [Dimorphilus gyrociliatus]|uniref:DgyrCDS1489 n=1 Tax=Dimorphilus gyrociliatus TaxID=2664684 RepID=A0A7I8V7J7_9ANNE|nr:DgyrCDS1489 [Dimorphilus gyrociliatus]
MAINNIILELKFKIDKTTEEDVQNAAKEIALICLGENFSTLTDVQISQHPLDRLLLFMSQLGNHLTVRFYDTGIATVDIQYSIEKKLDKFIAVMISEKNDTYTPALARLYDQDYQGKKVLILGGGDGALLYSLVKKNASFVTLVEIDKEVIDASRCYLKKLCNWNELEKYTNYEIIIDDCLVVLKDSFRKSLTYDIVINDLTEFPVQMEKNGFTYDMEFSKQVMELSVSVLSEKGVYLSRGNCVNAKNYHEIIIQNICGLNCKFKCEDTFVPCFHESYRFYKLWK